ncbi:hypothetical protein [Rodentibacter rarus]|uniref:hypothetical protein n=1 Tax=Rodentibacter rarus TaxID=1908260 RepID=UPI000987ADE2|nr:hypothetical protein [Rodentibacter rarus]
MCHRKRFNIYSQCFLALWLFPFSIYANTEGAVDETDGQIRTSLVRYVGTKEQHILTTDIATQDAKDLGNSIEFEVYKVDEKFASRSVFLSPAGICKGFNGSHGVEFTNFTNHYINNGDDSQYYGGITGASLYRERDPSNMQYVPIYVIKNPHLEKEIREREMKKTKDIARDKIFSSEQLLDKIICKSVKK